MVKTIDELLIKYHEYADPIGKISREVKKRELFPIVKGLYETDATTPGLYLTSYIYGPSYVSFEYALSFHGLIPERVTIYTSATFGKRKTKTYKNGFGVFTYRDIPKSVFPFGVKAVVVENYSYIMATPEKALCDQLYIAQPQTSIRGMYSLLFENLRIDKDAIFNLNIASLINLSEKYRSTNLKLFKKILTKETMNL